MPSPLSRAPADRRTATPKAGLVALALLAVAVPASAGTTGAAAHAAPKPGATAAKRRTEVEFFARSSAGHISCAIYDGYGGVSQAFCESFAPHRESKATLDAKGKVVICTALNIATDACGLGNAGEGTPTYRYGRGVTVGRFRCVVRRNGVRCFVRATGKGFLFNPRKAIGVGGATVRSSSI